MDVKTPLTPIFPDGSGLPDGALHEVAASAHGAVDNMTAGAHAMALSVDPAIDRVAHLGHRTIDHVTDGAESSVEWLRKNPLQSAAIALAAGFLVGRWRRRSAA